MKGLRTKIYPDGSKYVGQWKDNKQNGQGIYTWPDGSKYVGQFKNGKMECQGTYTWSDGTKYIGQWKNGKIDGQGTYTWSDGNKHVGQWKEGKMEGKGVMTWPSGNKYVGQYKNGKQNGQGTYTWSDGDKYIGQHKNGKMDGRGAMILPDGTSYVGQWKNDKLKGERTYLLADGAKPDLILLNDISDDDFEFVSFKYNRDYNHAPWIAESEEKKNCSIKEYKRNIRSLKAYARRNDIHLIQLKDFMENKGIEDLKYSDCFMKQLKKCGQGYEISDDLYYHVSHLYADLYKMRTS